MGALNVWLAPDGSAEAAHTGWCHDSPDGDKVTVSRAQLASAEAFEAWLRDVATLSTLAKQARDLAAANGVTNVSRDPLLPLTRYLHFLTRYVRCAARHVLERSVAGEEPFRIVVVGHGALAVRGGALAVPWNVDPADLVQAVEAGSSGGPLRRLAHSGE